MSILMVSYKIVNRLYVGLGRLNAKLFEMVVQNMGKTTQKTGVRIGNAFMSLNERIK